MPQTVRISAAEWEVMHVLWQAGSPVPARRIVEVLAQQRRWRPSTSRTLLRRLVRRRAVGEDRTRRPAQYRPLVSREASVRVESRTLLQRAFGGQPVELLVHLVEETPLTPEEIARLRAILARKEE